MNSAGSILQRFAFNRRNEGQADFSCVSICLSERTKEREEALLIRQQVLISGQLVAGGYKLSKQVVCVVQRHSVRQSEVERIRLPVSSCAV